MFNNDWDLAALHHAGVPARDEDGNILLTTGAVWDRNPATADLISWVANEGVRILSIVTHLRQCLTDGRFTGDRSLLQAALAAADIPGPGVTPERGGTSPAITGPRIADGRASWDLTVSIDLADLDRRGDRRPTPPPLPDRDYYDPAADQAAATAYHAGIDPTGDDLFRALSDLARSTHTVKLTYREARLDHLYPVVDLHPDRQLRSVYSDAHLDPGEVIAAELAVEQTRQDLLRAFTTAERFDPSELGPFLARLEADHKSNCEHVVPQSWFGAAEPMRSDLHHLFTCDPGCNSFRSNIPYWDFPEGEEAVRTNCGRSADRLKFEPDAHHGAVARATLYFLIRYPGHVGDSPKELPADRLDILLAWHTTQPPHRLGTAPQRRNRPGPRQPQPPHRPPRLGPPHRLHPGIQPDPAVAGLSDEGVSGSSSGCLRRGHAVGEGDGERHPRLLTGRRHRRSVRAVAGSCRGGGPVFMQQRCGAWQVGTDRDRGEVEFRVFFPAGVDPHVAAIRVGGDFQAQLGGANWDYDQGVVLTAQPSGDPDGTFWSARTGGLLPAGFYEYGYQVDFDDGTRRVVADPCARYSGLAARTSGVVVGGSSPADNPIVPLAGGRLPLSELTIYELMIDDFTAEYRGVRAPMAAVVDRLDQLHAMGVNAILFMPWTAGKHRDFDWGYEPFQYYAVEARYTNQLGQPAEKLSWLKQLVSACHQRGIHVLMDGVFNHVSTEFPYQQLYRDPEQCPFTAQTFVRAFPGLQDLDFSHPITGELVRDVCRYWIDTFDLDGIRFDNTVNFYQPGDTRGLPELLDDVAAHTAGTGRANFSLTLEHLDLSAAQVTNTTAAHSFWDNSLFAATFDALWHGHIDAGLLAALNNRRFLTDGKTPTLYLSNHDHSQIGWQAGARDNMGAVGRWWRTQPFLIALYTATAVPLLHNGQEFGEEHFLPEDDRNTGRRVTGRPLRWKLRTDPIGRTLVALHTTLGAIRHAHPALRSPHMYPAEWPAGQTRFTDVGVGVDTDRQLAVYHRWAHLPGGVDNLVVVLNFSPTDHTVDVPVPYPGTWTDLLAGFLGGPTWTVDTAHTHPTIPVGSHWGRILHAFNPTP